MAHRRLSVNTIFRIPINAKQKAITFYPSYLRSYKNYLSYGQLSSFDDLPKPVGEPLIKFLLLATLFGFPYPSKISRHFAGGPPVELWLLT